MRPGTLVAIFGDRFTPGGDKVLVAQGANQYTVQAGGPFWYDSVGQINAVLPLGLQPGEAQVRVVNVNGRQSDPAPITIVP